MSFPNNEEPMQMDASMDDVDVYEISDSSNSENLNYQVDSAPFEIESYASQYSGYSKLIRLLYIADHCPPLKIDALEHALKYTYELTYDVDMYTKIHNKLTQALSATGEHQIIPFDNQWKENTSNLNVMTREKLETDLKNYKTNSIKESIRRGHDDLGAHFLRCGDLINALKCYSRSRDYCMGDHHLFNICLNVITLNVYLKNWNHVSSYIQKAENTEFFSNVDVKSKINCIAGLNDMVNKRYKNAAERFVRAQFDDLGQQFTEIMSPNNVAIYGGLCALASFDREELRKRVLHNPYFRLFLELEPQLREAINRFLESKYPDCLKLLDELKDSFLLDLYLAPHVKALYSLIRSRALTQYFTPYLSANMNTMATAFNTDVASLEDELMGLILDGQIEARIDSHNKILYAKESDPRLSTFDFVLQKGRDWQMKTSALILRTAVARNGLISVKQFTPSQSNNTSSTTTNNIINNNSNNTTKQTSIMDTADIEISINPEELLSSYGLQQQQPQSPPQQLGGLSPGQPVDQLINCHSPATPSPVTPPSTMMSPNDS